MSHKGTYRPAPKKPFGYMIPKHCDGSCGLQHDAPFPFEMSRGKFWGRHVARTVRHS